MDQEAQAVAASTAEKVKKSKEPWNGHDWYVSSGEFYDGRSWEDVEQSGFVSAGGGKWFSGTMKNLPVGESSRLHCEDWHVEVGQVLGEAKRFVEATVQIDGGERQLADLLLAGDYRHPGDDVEVTPAFRLED